MDNIFVERLWRSLKYEEVYLNAYASVSEAKAGIGAWLDFYNEERQHQSLGYRTPRQFTRKACGYVDDRRCRPAPLPPLPELGGKSPQIVFADADLDQALPVVVNAIVQNAGQTCSAGSRALIERPDLRSDPPPARRTI